MEPLKLRKDFPIFRGREVSYLDNAATSQKPDHVIESISEFYRESNASAGRGLYGLAGEATEKYSQARSTVADFIGADSGKLVFVRNTTEAENLLAESLEFDGDIILSEMAHHSEQLPWRKRARQDDRRVKWLGTQNGKISVESAENVIDEETGLVAISHISNVFGAENPVEEIVELSKEKDALVVLDGAQSVPHMPVDVKELGVDFLCFSGHKMLGPSGIGCLYGRSDLLEEMKPYQVGGGMIHRVGKHEVDYSEAPGKFEAGTENVAGAVGLSEAVEYLESVGLEEVYKHDRKLSRIIRNRLEDIEGVRVLSPEESVLVSFRCDFAHPHDVAEILDQNDVAVRAGHHCAQPLMNEMDVTGTVRASPYLYNTEKDVEKLVEAVKEVKRVFEG